MSDPYRAIGNRLVLIAAGFVAAGVILAVIVWQVWKVLR